MQYADIVLGVTTIYIAQEYAEKGYAGGLVKKYHIHDLAKAANGGKQGRGQYCNASLAFFCCRREADLVKCRHGLP